jgi:uncharacterized protein (DUF1697 family)
LNYFIALLRGINVSGHNPIKMAGLRSLLEEAGWMHVQTYLQSGNIVIGSLEKLVPDTISMRISALIKKRFYLEVPVLVLRAGEIYGILKENPFLGKPGISADRLFVTFLFEQPEIGLSEQLSELNFHPDEFKIVEKRIYLHCPISYGNSKLSNTMFEKKLKIPATTRNWKTVSQLAEMIKSTS